MTRNSSDDYDKAREPQPLAGGFAEHRWWTGIVVGHTSKLDKPQRICLKLPGDDLVIFPSTVATLGTWQTLKPGEQASVYARHKRDEVWSVFGNATLLQKVEHLLAGQPPAEAPAPLLVVETRGKPRVPLKAIANATGLTVDAVRDKAETGEIPARRLGRSWSVDADDIKVRKI